jgi:hypothetical protein
MFTQVVVGPGSTTNSPCLGPVIAVTNRGTNCSVTTIVSNDPISVVVFSGFVPADSFAETYTIVYTNATSIVSLTIPPVFVVRPENASGFVGTSASFNGLAIHTTGWRWQKDGTDLVENDHYRGVTNSTLTISNLQPADAGVYSAVASQPGGPDTASVGATLSVFKPLRLSLSPWLGQEGFLLTASNLDGTPIEAERVSKLGLYMAPNVSLGFQGWGPATNALALTNGVVETTLWNDGSRARFWRVLESP